VQKADADPRGECEPEKVALDETVVKVEGEQYWFLAAVEPSTNSILHTGLSSHRNMAMTSMFLEEPGEKHDFETLHFSSMAVSSCTQGSRARRAHSARDLRRQKPG
jgi:putative transposase